MIWALDNDKVLCDENYSSFHLYSYCNGFVFPSGGWSLLNMTNESSWDINGIGSFMAEKILGSSAFFTIGVAVDDKNSTAHIIEVMLQHTTILQLTIMSMYVCVHASLPSVTLFMPSTRACMYKNWFT